MSLPSKRQSLIGLLLLTVIGLGLAWFLLKIETLECYIETQPCPESITSQLQKFQGRRILFFNDPALNQSSLTAQYRVKQYSLRLPNTLIVELQPQVPAYTLISPTQEILVINTEGQVLGHESNAQSPQVYVSEAIWSNINPEQAVNSQLHQLITSSLTQLGASNLHPTALYLLDLQTLVVYLPNQPQIVLDPTQATVDVARLKIALSELPNHQVASQVREVDVRFKLPVLRNEVSIPRQISP